MRGRRALFPPGRANRLIALLQAVGHDDPVGHLDDALRVLRHLRVVGHDDDGVAIRVQLLQDGMNKLAGSEYLTVDGKWGPKTDYALKHAHHDGLAYAMCALRMAEYNRRARKDKAKQVFLGGWLNRVADLMVAI